MLIALSLGVQLPIRVFILFSPIMALTLAFPITISGIGARESIYFVLYGAMGVAHETALAMSVMDYLLTYVVVGLIGGFLYAISGILGLAQENKNNIETEQI